MRVKMNTYTVLEEKLLRRPRRRWEDDIMINLRETGSKKEMCRELPQDCDQCWIWYKW
jgi:hypothetical protein